MKKILIIEDETVLGDVLLQKLTSSGFTAELMRDGITGFDRIIEWMPDLVLLDVILPHINGLEILKQKASDLRIAGIPTIILTNSFHPISGTEIDKLGVTDFLVKSDVNPEKIVERIKAVFANTPINVSDSKTLNSLDVLSGKKILLVEDDDFLGSIMLSRLSARDAHTVVAKNGEDALVELSNQKFDAVLLDVLLPGMSGFDVLESIRKDEKTKNFPVTVISNFNQQKDRERAASLGAGFFVKALVSPDDIVNQVEQMLLGKHL